MDQFHFIDRSARQQRFFLPELELDDTVRSRDQILPTISLDQPKPYTLLQEIVHCNQDRMALVDHEVIQKLMELKWDTFASDFHWFEIWKYVVIEDSSTFVFCFCFCFFCFCFGFFGFVFVFVLVSFLVFVSFFPFFGWLSWVTQRHVGGMRRPSSLASRGRQQSASSVLTCAHVDDASSHS